MSTYAAKTSTVSVENFFNPYAGLGPPACCYCAPTGVPIQQNTTNISNITNQQQAAAAAQNQMDIQVQVNASIQAAIPGLSSLAMMTKVEDAFRTLERGRIEARERRYRFTPGTAEMGHGPFFYPKEDSEKYVP